MEIGNKIQRKKPSIVKKEVKIAMLKQEIECINKKDAEAKARKAAARKAAAAKKAAEKKEAERVAVLQALQNDKPIEIEQPVEVAVKKPAKAKKVAKKAEPVIEVVQPKKDAKKAEAKVEVVQPKENKEDGIITVNTEKVLSRRPWAAATVFAVLAFLVSAASLILRVFFKI